MLTYRLNGTTVKSVSNRVEQSWA